MNTRRVAGSTGQAGQAQGTKDLFSNYFDKKKNMINDSAMEDLAFEVNTPLGFTVRVTRAYWELIISVKHPVMSGHESDVKESLSNPDEIRVSRSDPAVYLFYKSQRAGRWICAVVKRLDGHGFLITTYPTDSIKEGEEIWPK